MTTTQVALRNNANFNDNSIITILPIDTLLYLNGQVNVNGTLWTGAQTYLGESIIGLLPFTSVRAITPGEAQFYINAYNAAHTTPTPSPSPSPTPTPAQQTGYFITVDDYVPLRAVPGTQASISTWIAKNQVVYVSEQVYSNGYGWHMSNYNGLYGYIRQDHLRAMSALEVNFYLSQYASTPTPTPVPQQTAAPYNPYALSSYGYVTANAVNLRQTPNGARIGVLNKYAFALVLGSQFSGGTQWYNINQSGIVGWVNGNFFKVMNIAEFTSFLGSGEYLQGIINNDSPGTPTGTSAAKIIAMRHAFRHSIGLRYLRYGYQQAEQ